MVKIGELQLSEFPLLLAPMEDVSDPPFRMVCKDNGADVMYSEFVSSEGLIRNAAKSKKKLDIFEREKPIGIQIYGDNIESLVRATKMIEHFSPDLLDINFGCPVKRVALRGAGAGLLKDVDKMVEITSAIVKATSLPVTVKTRLGWDEKTKNIEVVAERLQDAGIKALTIHGRTRVQMYKGEADWELIGKIKNNARMTIPIFGNGDINSPEKAWEYKNRYGVDGIMIGRAAIGYPWIFREIKYFFETKKLLPPPSLKERIEVCKKHLRKSLEWKGDKTGIFEMRRHYSNYLKGLPNIKNYRYRLVTETNESSIWQTLDEIEKVYDGFEFALEHPPLIDYHIKCKAD